MKKIVIVMLVLSVLIVSCSKQSDSIVNVKEPEKMAEKAAYATGSMLYQYYGTYFGIKKDTIGFFLKGMYDKANDKALFTEEEAQQIMTEFGESELKRMQTENIEKAEAFLLENGKKDGVVSTDSGLQYQVITEGNGVHPTDESTVNVYYKLTTAEGQDIETVDANNGPASFPITQLVPGVTEGLKLMSEGAKYRFWIHPSLGYGENGSGAIEPNQLLVFEFELLSIN